jgi:hypothetical protein
MGAKGDEEEDSCAERKEEDDEEVEAEGMRVQSESEPLEPLDASLWCAALLAASLAATERSCTA